MTGMKPNLKIYVDFDDCLCETARTFSKLAAEMFGIIVPYEEIRFFDLDLSFGLNNEQFEQFMIRGHEPEVLLSYEETPGASSVIREWISSGYEVSVITGRPTGAYEPSRRWLDLHGLQDARLYCLNKYGRDGFATGSGFNLELEDFRRMDFDFAVEDSPRAFQHLHHLPGLRVLVFDRPWNRDCEFPNENYRRCRGWESVRKAVAEFPRMTPGKV